MRLVEQDAVTYKLQGHPVLDRWGGDSRQLDPHHLRCLPHKVRWCCVVNVWFAE